MSKGTVKEISKRISFMKAMGQGEYTMQLMHQRNELLTNGGKPPIPQRMPNQRQKRKLNRQMM